MDLLDPSDPPAVRYLLACDALAAEAVVSLMARFRLLDMRDAALCALRRELAS